MRSALNKYNNLTQRIIAALVGATLIITCVVWNQWSFFAIFFFIGFMSMLEFYKLLGLDGEVPLKTFGIFTGMLIYTIVFLNQAQILGPEFYTLIFPVMASIFLVMLYKKDRKKPFTNIAFTFLGVIYVALPFSLLVLFAFHGGVYNFVLVFGTLFIIWASDTGAYIAGSLFGKRQLFARVSPKKSWEGMVGGLILALGMGAAICWGFGQYALWQWLCIALIISVTGTYGDLVESLFKRSIEIKDSGSVIPGHGGFLDRFDSLLIASPFILLFIKFFG